MALVVAASGCASREQFTVPAPPEPVSAEVQGPLPDPAAGPLTAAEAVRIAIGRNPDLKEAAARVELGLASLDAAHAALRPVLGADLSYLGGDAPSAYLFKTIDARDLPPGVNFNDPGTFGNWEVGTTLRWNLWRGGRDRLGIWASESGVAAAEAEREAVRNGLVAGVLAAILDVRAARELEAADEASIRSVVAQVDETRVRVDSGQSLRSDLLSLEVRLAEARERRIRTDVAQRLATVALRRLLAWPDGMPLEVADEAYPVRDLPATVPEALAVAYTHRGEVAAARRAVERARIEVESARRAYSPSLDLEARWYGDDEQWGFAEDGGNWLVGLALSYDLYDGGRKRAGVRAAQAVLDHVEEADRRALLAVAQDVETAYLRLEESRARLDVASQAVGASEEGLDLVEKQYRGGTATVTRYLEAEAARTQARTARIRAALDVEGAQIDAARSLGRAEVER
ncbi:MAG: TolC family protein [Planctomycetes bacterium]|nr:TolC family protein [Planctomycetota bacterium]